MLSWLLPHLNLHNLKGACCCRVFDSLDTDVPPPIKSTDLSFGTLDGMLHLSILNGGRNAFAVFECALAFSSRLIDWSWRPYLHVLGKLQVSFCLFTLDSIQDSWGPHIPDKQLVYMQSTAFIELMNTQRQELEWLIGPILHSIMWVV